MWTRRLVQSLKTSLAHLLLQQLLLPGEFLPLLLELLLLVNKTLLLLEEKLLLLEHFLLGAFHFFSLLLALSLALVAPNALLFFALFAELFFEHQTSMSFGIFPFALSTFLLFFPF